MREATYSEIMIEGFEQALQSDKRTCIINGPFIGLGAGPESFRKFVERNRERVLDTPTSEYGYCSLAVGAAMAGMRPIVDLGTASFIFNAWPVIINEASIAHYMNNGQTNVPAIFHFLAGVRGGGGTQHSYSPQSMFWNTPGLEIMLPSSPADLKGLLKTATTRKNPVIFVDHFRLLNMKGKVPDGNDYSIPFGQGEVKRSGRDVTVVATSYMVKKVLDAANRLSGEGIDVEVVDPRTIVPLDKKIILDSVAKTGRLVVVDEGQRSCGVASEILAIVAEEGFSSLKGAAKRVTIPDVPIPFSKPMEEYVTPSEERIVASVRAAAR
jgi:acetoin:2,6-dichlorophenolindophenol oxidoreductase subunit beta